MSAQFNRPELVATLRELTGSRGDFPVELEGTVQPVVVLAEAAKSPALRYRTPVMMYGSQPATAAENGFVGVRAGPNVALQIVKVFHRGPATNWVHGYQLLNPTQVATLGVTSGGKFEDVAAREGAGDAVRSSEIVIGTNAGALGSRFTEVNGLANAGREVDLPDPGIVLYGNDPVGRAVFAIMSFTLNELHNVGFFGYEWPLPG